MTLARFTASDGVTLAYDDRGDGPPLVCLAGLTRNMGDFESVLGPLGARCRLIRPDYRGRGLSDRADWSGYTLAREGQDLLELLDHLDLPRAAILGTSRGGMVALDLAPRHRHRLTGVILNDIGPVIEDAGLGPIFDYLGRAPVWPTLEAAGEGLAQVMAGAFPGVTAAEWRARAAHWYDEGPQGLSLRYDPSLREAFLAMAEGGRLPPMWEGFAALAGLPVGVIRGANSGLLSRETVAEMARRHPGLVAAEVPDRGHVPFLDEPEALAAIHAVLDLIDRQQTEGRTA
ncbi:alpha/beta fold hydrolase [Frigidibacter oleivorans]|uniref:alpha/beta fold hydrolase n=1 Tax=Frigidibacter oleivorans TaxID=2487129 RepID=UPI000F8F7701|nr:alpha/beta hydrolase [Frigidibacter oleivorans]